MNSKPRSNPTASLAAEATVIFLGGATLIQVLSSALYFNVYTHRIPFFAVLLFLPLAFIGMWGLKKAKTSLIYLAIVILSLEFSLSVVSITNSVSGGTISFLEMVPFLSEAALALGGIVGILRFSDVPASYRSSLKGSGEYAIESYDLVKVYGKGDLAVKAVDGITLKVKRGDFVAIMGPSGCGKSTLMHLLGALDRPTEGTILIDGVDLSELDDLALARLRNEKIGFVFQAYNLINRSTVMRNIELPMLVKATSRGGREKMVKDLLERMGIGDKVVRKPRELSGGEQQRVTIARALVNNPSIVLADEPTGNLDSKSGGIIMDLLRRMNEETGTTVIVVTHDRQVAEYAKRIVQLKDGKFLREEVLR
jgi:putative ABC transport system ATP-binding protein